MAHESFEDPAIAALMNELFVNIKVDREERPDLDAIYQYALALLGEQGGWPLTMFLTPDGEPFWGGTYFPPSARYGRPGFRRRAARRRRRLPRRAATRSRSNVAALREALAQLAQPQARRRHSRSARSTSIAERLLRGGRPRCMAASAARRNSRRPGDLRAAVARLEAHRQRAEFRDAVTVTLDQMCQGGIYDHLGGGFARYSTDAALAGAAFREDALRQCAS